MSIIEVENLSKKYILSHQQQEPYTALRDVIAGKFKSLSRLVMLPSTPRAAAAREDFWALNKVSFKVERGDRVGIVGRNGAGKSTLLKILSRITEPTGGKVGINGRVASLLEVGTGFHQELTGRENIYLNGAILGMARAEIKRKFDEIVAFAEVEKFLDTPVKHYSSGMYVRLAFAVAAHLEPEILLVDEVLAVGDASFQKKCLGKMEDVSKNEGRTILFVSHNLTAIQNLCSKVLYLNDGYMVDIGPTNQVVEHYLNDGISMSNLMWQGEHVCNEYLRIEHIRIIRDNTHIKELYIDEEIQIEFSVDIFRDVSGIAFELFVYTMDGTVAFSSFTDTMTLHSGNVVTTCIIPKNLMNDGHYSITVGISKNYSFFLVKISDALTIDLLGNPEGMGFQGAVPGVVRPKLNWTVAVTQTPTTGNFGIEQ